MASAALQLKNIADRIRSLGTINADVAKRAAPGVEKAIRDNIAGGKAPDGSTWQAKKDGGRPLANAASKIAVAVAGTTIVVLLKGYEVFQHFGVPARKLPARKILPDADNVPEGVIDAIRKAASDEFLEKMGRKS
jgi:hypothetical protein